MVKVSLNYMDESPHLTLLEIPEMTEKERELFTKQVLPGMQKDLDIAFMQYKRNSPELASMITQIMKHGSSLKKSRYCFNYYENENHVGFYWYDKKTEC